MVLMLILSFIAVAGCVMTTIASAFLIRSSGCQLSIECPKGSINDFQNPKHV